MGSMSRPVPVTSRPILLLVCAYARRWPEIVPQYLLQAYQERAMVEEILLPAVLPSL